MTPANKRELTAQRQVDLSTHCARRALRAPSKWHVERRAVCSGWISRTLSLQNPKNSVALLDFKDGIYFTRFAFAFEPDALKETAAPMSALNASESTSSRS